MELSDLKDIATIAKPFIDPIISTILAPTLEKLKARVKEKTIKIQVSNSLLKETFEDYLLRTYQRCSIINILVFPNQQIKIKDIYLPLTISSSKGNERFIIDIFRKKYITPYRSILISDAAGMGKSTLAKWITLSLIEQSISIPILIELKRINQAHTIIDEICNQIDPINKSFDRDLILEFLDYGSFTILLDGFDEVDPEIRQSVIDDIKSLGSKASKNWFILTSRPDPELAAFGDFQMFNVVPLTKQQSFKLIDIYDSINTNKIAESLKKDIKSNFEQSQEFLTNPFLVSLLYKTYTYNKDIPSKKSAFYEEIYLALYKHHDLSKDGFKRNKRSGLDIHDFRSVLRQLAFDTAKQVKSEYTENQLIRLLDSINKKNDCIKFNEQDYIEDLEFNVPIFSRDGRNLRWAHKSVQDYFAAEFISSHPKKEEIINRLFLSEKNIYLYILDFLFELELHLFKKTIVLNLLKDFIKYCESTYQDIHYKKKIIRERQSLTYGIFFCVQQSNGREWIVGNRVFWEEKIGNHSIAQINFCGTKAKPFIEIYGTSFKQQIINLLGQKGEKYVKRINTPNRIHVTRDVKCNLEPNEMLLINDNPKNPLNNKENFELVNSKIATSELSTTTSRDLYALDYEASLREIKSLEKQIRYLEDQDILADI